MKAYELNSNRELRSNLRIDTAIVPALDTGNIVIDQNDLLQNLAGPILLGTILSSVEPSSSLGKQPGMELLLPRSPILSRSAASSREVAIPPNYPTKQ